VNIVAFIVGDTLVIVSEGGDLFRVDMCSAPIRQRIDQVDRLDEFASIICANSFEAAPSANESIELIRSAVDNPCLPMWFVQDPFVVYVLLCLPAIPCVVKSIMMNQVINVTPSIISILPEYIQMYIIDLMRTSMRLKEA
jgi:hypothetical protein